MRSKLFNCKIAPSCSYCSHGDISKDGTVVLCEKRGIMEPHASCRAFDYSPLKRIPKKPRALPQYSPEDFEL